MHGWSGNMSLKSGNAKIQNRQTVPWVDHAIPRLDVLVNDSLPVSGL
jgi:hypothetical protein